MLLQFVLKSSVPSTSMNSVFSKRSDLGICIGSLMRNKESAFSKVGRTAKLTDFTKFCFELLRFIFIKTLKILPRNSKKNQKQLIT